MNRFGHRTAKPPPPTKANEVNHTIRAVLESLYAKRRGRDPTILYGGSMNAGNADELLSRPMWTEG
jgi:triosephosphate isomerase